VSDGAFHLRKLYADLVSPDGCVIVVYLGWLTAAGLRVGYAAVEHYAADGTRRVYRGQPVADEPARHPDGSLEYAVRTRDGRTFRLVHHDQLPAWVPAGPAISPHVRWQVAAPAARATASWDDDADWSAAGRGYADQVTLLRPPRLLGLRRLRWGRAHLPGRTVVFNAVDLTGTRWWARTAEWPTGGARTVHSNDRGPLPDDRTVLAPGGHLTLTPLRVLHEGDPLDRERFPGSLERWAGRAANGPAHEVRYLSRATALDGTGGMALHESVRFGRAAGTGPPLDR
jgi:hypothetical protein